MAIVRFTEQALEQLDDLTKWWDIERPEADPVQDLVNQILSRVSRNPALPRVFKTVKGVPVRRVLIPPTPYHIYYEVDASRLNVLVVAVWSAERGEGPDLGD